jgi:ribosome maturation factor RimP
METEKEQLIALLEPLLEGEGCELADLVTSKYKSSTTVRVFVYSNDGVSLDRCADLSTLIGDMIDGTSLFGSGYTLEVSSPGLTRPLSTERDFRFRIGERVSVSFVDRKRKKLTAEIVGTEAGQVRFKDDSGEHDVPLSEIESAKIQF